MCPPRPCATCPPACEPADGQPAPSVRMRSTPIAVTTMTNTAGKFARLGSSRSSPVAASNMIPGWACTAGSLSRVSPYCTGSAGSASDGKSATTSTKASSASPAPSSAGDASTTSQTVRSSKGRSATMQKSHIWRPAIFIRLQAEAEQSGGSARAYLADLSPHQRPSHPGRPRHDSEPGLHISACRTNGAPPWGQARRLRSWFMPQNFLYPQRDQPLLMPADMREWLPEDDLVYVVLDAVATLDLGEFRRRYRADGHGRAAFDPEMMVALLLYGYCQGERSSRVIERRCVRDVGYWVITGGLHPDHATIARFRACHQEALGGLFSQVLRLLAAEGMVSLGTISLDGTKLAGNASQKANKTLPQIEKLLAEAAAADAAEDARYGDALDEPTPRALARRAERRERLAAARDRLAAEDAARRDAQRAKQ